jgi:hypothetical protein
VLNRILNRLNKLNLTQSDENDRLYDMLLFAPLVNDRERLRMDDWGCLLCNDWSVICEMHSFEFGCMMAFGEISSRMHYDHK